MSELKSDIAKNADKIVDLKSYLKSDIKEIKTSQDNLVGCVGTFDACIKKVEKLAMFVPDLVQTVTSKLSKNSNNLIEIGNRITHNRDSIVELQDSVNQMSKRKAEPSAYPTQ